MSAGHTAIFSNNRAFAALAADGSISAWGDAAYGGTGAPSDNGYTHIYSTSSAFAAIKADGSVSAWGNTGSGGSGAPADNGYAGIFSTNSAFAAIKHDGSLSAWGAVSAGGANAPADANYATVFANRFAFVAQKANGSLVAWGDATRGGSGAPAGRNYASVYSTNGAFAALAGDGSVSAWGDSGGATGAPLDSVYTHIASTYGAFAALKDDGSIVAWGNGSVGGSGAPATAGHTQILSNGRVFTALRPDGSMSVWGPGSFGQSDAPVSAGHVSVNGSEPDSSVVCRTVVQLGVTELIEDVSGNANQTVSTADQINSIRDVSGARAENEAYYTAGLQAGQFLDPTDPIGPEIQLIINQVNATRDVIDELLEDIAGNNNQVRVTAQQLNSLEGVEGALSLNLDTYIMHFRSATFADALNPSREEIQVIIDLVNSDVLAPPLDIGGGNSADQGSVRTGTGAVLWVLLLAPLVIRRRYHTSMYTVKR